MKVQHFQQQLLRSVAHMPAPPRARPSCPRPTCRLTCPLCPSSDAAWAPLDLPSLVAAHLPGGRERVFWKLVLVLPANGEEQPAGSPGRILANWLKVKFMGGNDWADTGGGAGGIQTLTLFNALSSKGDQTISVNVCIKVSDSHCVHLLL